MTKKVFIALLSIGLILTAGLAIVGQTTETQTKSQTIQAYREVNFLDSRDTVRTKIEDNEELGMFYQLGDKITALTRLNDVTCFLDLYFYQDELYQVRLVTYGDINKTEFGAVQEFRDFLADTLLEKYGQPTWQYRLSSLDVAPGMIRWSHLWDPETTGAKKEYKLGISRALGLGESYSEFGAVMQIEYPPLLDEKLKSEEKQAVEKEEETEGQTEGEEGEEQVGDYF